MQHVKLSILMASYNMSDFIGQALESVIRQSYENWEIVIVDDASTDQTLLLLEKYASDERIKVYVNDMNRGVGYTKRKCVELAGGDICGFLDPDDMLADDAVAFMVARHKEKPECSLIYSKTYLCDKNLSVIGINSGQRQLLDSETFLEVNGGAINHFATFKTGSYGMTSGIDASMKRAIDIDLYYKLEEVGRTCFIDIPLYYYRLHSGGISTGGNAYLAKSWHIYAMMNACQRRNLDFEEYLAKFLSDTIDFACHDLCFTTKEYRVGKFLLSPLRKLNTSIRKQP
jgi:glycosyltransferase involved in cell wall biosynthesis